MCFLQVVVVFCLWGTDVSRAYVFQASGPSEGGDNPQPHTKGENQADRRQLMMHYWKSGLLLNNISTPYKLI